MTRAPKPGETVELTVEAIGGRGDGIAHHGDVRVFVPGTVPGDRLRVRITGVSGEGCTAETVERLADGPGRADPPCRHFGDCGGCAVQHFDDALYAGWKREAVVAALARRGLGETPVAPLLRTPPGGRRRVALMAFRSDSGLRLGFNARASRHVVDVAECPVMVPALTAFLPALRDLLGEMLNRRERAMVAVTATDSGLDVIVALAREPDLAGHERLAAFADEMDLARLSWRDMKPGPPEPVAHRRPVQASFAGVAVDLPPGSFLQPSAAGEAALVAEVVAAIGDGPDRIVDLYAGCGAFAFALAGNATVHAVEGDGAMAATVAAAAARAGMAGRVTAEARDLERRPLLAGDLTAYDAAVFDPPRAGARAQVAELAGSALATVVAVSCNPATFARDARTLVDGGYRLENVVPVDQFVWSHHVELVAVFRR